MSDGEEHSHNILHRIERKVDTLIRNQELIMSGQASIDAAVTAIGKAVAALQGGQALNTTALDAGVAELNAVLGGTGTGGVVTVTSPGDQTSSIAAGPVSLQIVAADSAGGQVLSFGATGLPVGLVIDSATGLISGTVTTAGMSAVDVSVIDGTGAFGSASFAWTVTA